MRLQGLGEAFGVASGKLYVVVVGVLIARDADEQRVEFRLHQVRRARPVVDELDADRSAREVAGMGDERHGRVFSRQRHGDAALGVMRARLFKPGRGDRLTVGQHVKAVDRQPGRRPEGVSDRHRIYRKMRAVRGRQDRCDRRQCGLDRLRFNSAQGRCIGAANGLVLVARLQDKTHNVGPIEPGAELRGGEKVGLLIPSAIDVPADQILAAGGSHVIAGLGPGDPFAGLRLDEKNEKQLAVFPAPPLDRAVALSRRDDFAIGREIDPPRDTRSGLIQSTSPFAS